MCARVRQYTSFIQNQIRAAIVLEILMRPHPAVLDAIGGVEHHNIVSCYILGYFQLALGYFQLAPG